jgi:cytidine deaminase
VINDSGELLRSALSGKERTVPDKPGLPKSGAAVMDRTGRIWLAGRVASEDRISGQCPERTALFYAITNGAEPIVQIVVSDDSASPTLTPCGECLEAIKRFAPDAKIYVELKGEVLGPFTSTELLP